MNQYNKRIPSLFSKGRLLNPIEPGKISFIDLVCAMAQLAGVSLDYVSVSTESVKKFVGEASRYFFVLVDGMGISQLEKNLLPDSFLRRNISTEMRSVFLSTTAAALTSLAVCRWPAEHGIPAWWTFLEKIGHGVLPLPFTEQDTNIPLQNLGISKEDVFPLEPVWGRTNKKILSIVPAELKDSIYTRYSAGGTPLHGYGKLADAFNLLFSYAADKNAPQFIYCYVPHLDEASHEKGSRDPQIRQIMEFLDKSFERLASIISSDARLIISADHGQTDVPMDKCRFILKNDDPITSFLQCRPTGEPCVPFFHIKSGYENDFYSHFMGRFGEVFELIGIDEVERMNLLGPVKISPITRQRLGSFIGICLKPAKFYIEPLPSSASHLGMHGGLSPEEMRIPLIVA